MTAFHGRCHCGAIAFTFETAHAPHEWAIRACQCSFCRAHGARTTTDPGGRVAFEIADRTKLTRYRFGTRSSDSLVCAGCGVYVAAVLTTPRGQFATLNTNAIYDAADVPQPIAVSYDDESPEERSTRREGRWTPVIRL